MSGIYRGAGGTGDSTTDATITEVTQQAVNAAASATAASTSASEASTSATSASTSETNAAAIEVVATASAASALASGVSAASSAASVLASETAAALSETNAGTSETNAATSASQSASSAANALSSQNAASGSEVNASSSATAAATSASTATTQASTATTKAAEALTSQTASATSAAQSATSATSAATSATSAATSLATFTGQYASQATAPSSPDTGDLWFDTTVSIMKVYNGASWANAGSSVNGIENSVQYIATAGQTTFSALYDVGYVDVYLNGILLATTDYTATNGSSVALDTGALVSDVVYIQAFGTFALADHYTKVASDARYAQETYVDTAISNLVDSSPAALDTLNELAAALGDDPNFATTVNANIATKLPLAGGTMTGVIAGFTSTGIDDNATSTAVTLDSSGNVGIGTSTPSAKVSLYANDTTAYNAAATDGQVGADASLLIENDANSNTSFSQIVFNPRMGYGFNRIVSSGGSSPYLAFGTNNTERMRIDTSGKVGIGTSSPSVLLDLESASPIVRLTDSDASGTPECQISGAGGDLIFDADRDNEKADSLITFKVDGSERMRIDSSGNLLVGTTSSVVAGSEGVELRGDSGYINTARNSTSFVGHMQFFNPNGVVGLISTSGSATSYNTSSDYRLKTNVLPMTGATATFMQLKPCNFEWISSGERVDGFLAHELQEVIPAAAHGTKDGMKDEEYEVTPAVYDAEGVETTPAVMGTRSVPDMQGIDQSKVVPLLVATLQEALAEIETLKTRLTALEE